MSKKKRKRKGLDVMAEEFAATLLYEASCGKVGRSRALAEGEIVAENPISFKDRRALLDSVTKLLAAQTPQEEEETSGINSFREHLRGGDSGEASSGDDTEATDDPA